MFWNENDPFPFQSCTMKQSLFETKEFQGVLGKIKMGGKKPKELQVPIKRNNSKCYLFITKIGTVPVPP